jgi:hypothetical protein
VSPASIDRRISGDILRQHTSSADRGASYGTFVKLGHDMGQPDGVRAGDLGVLVGFLYTSVAVGTLIGPSAAGFAFDFSHSYTLPILASAGSNIVAFIIVAANSEQGLWNSLPHPVDCRRRRQIWFPARPLIE